MFQPLKIRCKVGSVLAALCVGAVGFGALNRVMASDLSSIVDVTGAWSARDVLTSQGVEGGFTLDNGQVHSWVNGFSDQSGYKVGNIATGNWTVVGRPSFPIQSNGYGDAFGAYDSQNGVFYAGTYNDTGSGVYRYDVAGHTWTDLGVFESLYGADIRDGRLYVSGLNQIWNGSYGQANQIALYDLSGNSNHDVLIQATGNSAHVAVGPNGDVYYANYDASPQLYRWSSAQVDSVRADLGHGTAGGGMGDLFLTYADATALGALPAGANGIAVDDAGNVFVNANDGAASTLLMWNSSTGLQTIGSEEYGWFGAMDTAGDVLHGGALYLSSYGSYGLAEITYLPEPATLLLLAIGAGLGLTRRRRRVDGRRTISVAQVRTTAVIAIVAVTGLLIAGAPVLAGPYSPGKGGPAEAGFVDAGIAGFVGPAGLGVAATDTNGNYLNPVFVGWATGVVQYTPSDNVGTYGNNGIGSQFADPAKTLGPVTGNVMDIVSLGDMDATELATYFADPVNSSVKPGTLTLSFNQPITNGPGADFAAFENGFVSNYSTGAGSVSGQMFAELGYVEVSTDGTHYARFPSSYLNYPGGQGLPGNTAYLTQDVSNVYNLVGKHANAYSACWGTPFNLDDLVNDPLVADGLVDLSRINFVRIVDIAGNGTFKDANNNGIYDAWVTWGSGGLDFEALGVINQLPEPATLVFLGAGAILLGSRRRRGNGR